MSSLDETIRAALMNFAEELLDGTWTGQREREAVSAFAFGPLLQEVDSNGFLSSPSQIGIETAVPQVTRPGEANTGKKNQVCKDLVIWGDPQMTCWDMDGEPTRRPTAILEWKFSDDRISEYDVRWLRTFTGEYPECIGYAVTGNQPGSVFRLSCTRVSNGQVEPKWVYVP